jgi:hypothetical protein
VAIDPQPPNRDEQIAGLDGPRVLADGGDIDVAVADETGARKALCQGRELHISRWNEQPFRFHSPEARRFGGECAAPPLPLIQGTLAPGSAKVT